MLIYSQRVENKTVHTSLIRMIKAKKCLLYAYLSCFHEVVRETFIFKDTLNDRVLRFYEFSVDIYIVVL
jgi:hypothetical protein